MQTFSQQQVSVVLVSEVWEDETGAPAAFERDDEFAVETAPSAAEGRERVESSSPDCVVSEYELADTNGVEFLRTLREEFPELPFVLYVADGSEAVASEAISAGVTEYVRQGAATEYGHLRERIQEAIEGRRRTRRANRRAELRRLTDGLSDAGSFEIDLDAGKLLLTDGARELTGFDEGTEPSVDDVLSLHPPDDRQQVRQSIDRAVRTGERTGGVWEYRSLDGTERTAELTFIPVTTDEETLLRGVIEDVTEQRERRRELEQAETLFEHAQDGLFLVDVGEEFTIKRVNKAYEDATGLPREEIEDKTPAALLGEQQASEVTTHYRECVERREPLEYDEQLQFGEREAYWETRIAPVVIDGVVEYVAGSTREVTESKRRQQKLERLQQAIDGANVAMTLSDPTREDNPLVYVNDAFEEMTGYTEAEALGRNRQFLKAGENDPETIATLREALDDEEPVSVELRTARKNGTECWTRLSVSPIYDDGQLVRYIWTQVDITEQKQRERELREQRRFTEQALDALDDVFYVLNLDGTTRRWNSRVPEVTGYDESELEEMQALELFPSEDREALAESVQTVLTEGHDTIEADLLTADGERIPYEFVGARLTDADGSVTGVVGIGRDLTERKERERRLREQRRFTEQALDALEDVFYVLDPDGSISQWNERVPEVTGYTEADLLGMQAIELFPEDERETVADGVETALTEGRATIEADLLTTDDERVPYELTGARLTDADGDVTGVVGVGRDLTEHRERERRFRALVEESSDVITVVDEDGQIQYQSPTLRRILGYDQAEMTDDMAWEYIHPDDVESVMSEFEEWTANPEAERKVIQFRVRHADGSWRWMEARSNDYVDSSAVGGYVINSRDVTDRVEQQKQLDLLDRVLRHNLRNDLNVILGQAETIRLQSSGETASSAGQVIDVSKRLLRTAEQEREITDLLRETPEYSEVDLGGLLERIASSVASSHPDATVSTDCPETVTVRATNRLGAALRELITNAVIHNDTPSPEVTVTVTRTAETVDIEVVDNGPLIPEMERDVLVEQGEQTPLYHGSGLGLWFVSLVVSRSGGTITFEENSPTGNVVRVELPG